MTNQSERHEELRAYCEKYLHTLYLQHRSKAVEPVNEWILLHEVRMGIEEDTGIDLDLPTISSLVTKHVPAEHRQLTPQEADAVWYEMTGLKRLKKGGE